MQRFADEHSAQPVRYCEQSEHVVIERKYPGMHDVQTVAEEHVLHPLDVSHSACHSTKNGREHRFVTVFL